MDTILAPDRPASGSRDAGLLRLLFVSDVCFVREALASVLERDASIASVRHADPIEMIAMNLTAQTDAVLIHTALREGPVVAKRLRETAPNLSIIACALRETNDGVIAWAEAGVDGYIPNTVGLDQFVDVIKGILRGEQLCSGRVAAGLLRRVASAANPVAGVPAARWLTRRERQVAELVAARLGDKEIARHLNISLATTKSHVHNLLGKLNVRQRGDVVVALNGQQPPPPR
ncbi:MAG TPA: response regulator transcription factor [Stellaceae bacterium]|nr:response regulator transcription factor [Stellaceae bacterium]